MKKHAYYLLVFYLLGSLTSFSQTFPNPITLSTGQGAQGTFDPVWQVSQFWYAVEPNPMGLNYSPALINANCAPGAWVDASTLPPPQNNGNWITGPDADCANNISDGYRFFRLTLDLPPDCNGFSVTAAGNYVLTFDGYVDNMISNVYVNGVPEGISGGSFAIGSQLTFSLDGPWLVGTNYVDVCVYNSPNGTGTGNPYGLLLVANTATPVDTDNDGVANVDDLCPCDPGNNAVGCTDPANPNGCDIDAIRTAFVNAGCTEMTSCVGACSMYFVNPQSLSGSAAQSFAQTLGANLVSIQSQAENDCIISSLTDLGQTGVIWIGFNDETTENSFVWYDQAPVVYTNWAPGEPNNAGDEDCVQIYPDGMWNDLSSSTANAKSIIEVNLCPVVNTGPDITICAGSTANLNVVSMLFGSPTYNYTWNNGVVTASNPVSPTSSSDFSVISVDRYSCETTDTIHVTVNALPVVGAGNDQAVCAGGNVILTGTGATTYTWNNGVTNGSSFSPAATQTYTVTGTANGCQNTDQVVVTVNALPAVNAGTDQAVCAGSGVTLSGAGAVTYSWSNSVNNGTAFVPAGTQTYTVTGTDANNCQNTDQVLVTVNPLPPVNAGTDQSVCTGGTVTLAGSGAVIYTWNNAVLNGVAFSPATTQTYTVTGTDANNCQNTDQVTVTVNALPAINAGADQNSCLGSPVTLSGSGGITYTWTNGVTNDDPFSPVLGSSTYTVTGTDANGCQNTDQVTVNVVPVPVAGITSTDPLSGYPGLTVEFINQSQNSTSYTWNYGNGQTESSTNINDSGQSTFGSAGTYQVILTASNGICSDDASMTIIVVPFDPPIINAPNVFTPDGDGINDFFFVDAQYVVSMQTMVVNRWGNKVTELNGLTDKWDGTMNGNPAVEGTYFYTYTTEGMDGIIYKGQGFVEIIK